MKTIQLKQFFKVSLLTLALSSSMFVVANAAQVKDEVVAVVDNSVILRSDLDGSIAEIRHNFEQQNRSVPPQEYLEQQALDQLISRQAQLEQVKRYNIRIDDNALNAAVLKVAQDSGAPSLEAFQQQLDSMAPNTYASLRQRISEDLALNRLRQQSVMSRIQVTDQDVKNFLNTPQGQALLGNQIHVLHLRISGDPATLKDVATQVQNELKLNNNFKDITQKYSTSTNKVDGADMGLRSLSDIPAELAARVSTLEVGQITEQIAVQDGVHILKVIDRQSTAQKVIVPQFATRHILIKTSEVVSPENAQQMAQVLHDRIQKGEDFAVLAATFSNDPGSARDGGSLGWVSPGVMVPEFEQKMKETAVGQVSQPFQSQFGWHILQVTDKRDQDMTTEQQIRVARQVLGERQFNSELDTWMRETRNNAFVEIKDARLDPKKNQS
jgi:peptidyl-prolyl cis-trans isomerase SurA